MTTTNHYESFISELSTRIINSQNQEKTFQENLELWKSFYQNRDDIIKTQILNENLFIIIKFLLKQEHGEIFDYFHSNIIDTLSFHQSKLCFTLRNEHPSSEETIQKLFSNLNFYNRLVEYLQKNNIEEPLGSIQKYQSNQLEIDTIGALMVNIYTNFFELPKDLVKKTIEYIIRNTIHLEENKNTNKKLTYTYLDRLMYLDLLNQYLEKLLPLKVFLGEEIKKDLLVSNIQKGTIKNKKLLKNLFKKINITELLSIFNNNIVELINFLTNLDYLDEVEKQALWNQVADKLLKEDLFIYLLPLITEKRENSLVKNYFTKENTEKLIHLAKSSSPLILNEDQIHYLLDHEYIDIPFVINLLHMLNHQNQITENDKKIYKLKINKILKKYGYQTIEESSKVKIEETDSIETKIQKIPMYEFSGRIIDWNTSIELLRKYFQKQIVLDKYSIRQIIKSIGLHMLKEMNVSLNGIYFVDFNRANGAYYPDKESIAINNRLIYQLQSKDNSMYERLKIFSTLFHEMRHAKIQNDINHNIYNNDTYEMAKENILMEYDSSFYDTNYWNIHHEMDARIEGLDMLAKFIETYLPEFLDKIQYEIIKELEKEQTKTQKQNDSSKIDVFKNLEINFYQAFDTLIKYNPTILSKNPILLLEYQTDGTPKTYEEILSSKEENNQPLLDSIAKKRFPSSLETLPDLSSTIKSK